MNVVRVVDCQRCQLCGERADLVAGQGEIIGCVEDFGLLVLLALPPFKVRQELGAGSC